MFFLIVNCLFLRESRIDAGHPEATPNPLNLFAGSQSPPRTVRDLALPLLRSRAFVLVCLLSLGCTIIRETFNAWTPVYLRDYLGYSMGNAAGMSAVFPAIGAVSVVLCGWLSDQLGVNGRSLLLCVGLTATVAALLVLMSMHSSTTGALAPLIAIGTVAFCLLGPYSYLGGAFALDFGGKQASALSSGIIDGVGYLGAVVAGNGVAHVSVAFGWQGVFVALSAVSAVAALGAGYLYFLSARAAAQGTTSAMSGIHSVKRLSAMPEALTIEWGNGAVNEFASVWLRDNRREDRDPHSGQRLIDIADLPQDPRIRSAAVDGSLVRIEWQSEPHTASYEVTWLAAHAANSGPDAGTDQPRTRHYDLAGRCRHAGLARFRVEYARRTANRSPPQARLADESAATGHRLPARGSIDRSGDPRRHEWGRPSLRDQLRAGLRRSNRAAAGKSGLF